jgi:restriction system protein
MGTIRTSEGSLLDMVSEEVACSCGVLLTDNNVQVIASRYDIADFDGLSRGENRLIRIRPEEFEDAVLNVRRAIGNLLDTKPGMFILMDKVAEMNKRGIDALRIAEVYIEISKSGKYTTLTDEAQEEIISVSSAKAVHVYEFLITVDDMQQRELNFLYRRMKRSDWNGTVALDNLFQGEDIPNDPGVHLDQRFADYLAQNGEDMEKIHWRNFERLVTEFFCRRGYEVELGLGTKDGGRDIRVWTDKDSRSGPPVLLIQ